MVRTISWALTDSISCSSFESFKLIYATVAGCLTQFDTANITSVYSDQTLKLLMRSGFSLNQQAGSV